MGGWLLLSSLLPSKRMMNMVDKNRRLSRVEGLWRGERAVQIHVRAFSRRQEWEAN